MFHSGASAAERGSLRAIKVLVADDDPDTVLSLRMLLQTEGYDVRGVYNSVAVFEAVRKFEPSAVLLDIGMPDMSGYDVARQLRVQRGDELLLIAVTARVKASDRLLAQLAGFDHHVSKPYKPEDILSLLAPLSARRL